MHFDPFYLPKPVKEECQHSLRHKSDVASIGYSANFQNFSCYSLLISLDCRIFPGLGLIQSLFKKSDTTSDSKVMNFGGQVDFAIWF